MLEFTMVKKVELHKNKLFVLGIYYLKKNDLVEMCVFFIVWSNKYHLKILWKKCAFDYGSDFAKAI